MKQYDKIYVPDEKGELKVMQFYEDYHEWTDMHDGSGEVSEQLNAIVLTIEELCQLWNAGHSAGMEDAGATLKKPAVDFEAYLKSKGITI